MEFFTEIFDVIDSSRTLRMSADRDSFPWREIRIDFLLELSEFFLDFDKLSIRQQRIILVLLFELSDRIFVLLNLFLVGQHAFLIGELTSTPGSLASFIFLTIST